MKRKGRKEKSYIFVIDNSGFDSETEVRRMTGGGIRKLPHAREACVINGEVIKNFATKYDLTRL